MRVRITESGVSTKKWTAGPVQDHAWMPDLHAYYYRRILYSVRSHSPVDAINLWGTEPHTWMGGAGLLDEQFETKPAFEALRRLIHEELATRKSERVPFDGAIGLADFLATKRSA